MRINKTPLKYLAVVINLSFTFWGCSSNLNKNEIAKDSMPKNYKNEVTVEEATKLIDSSYKRMIDSSHTKYFTDEEVNSKEVINIRNKAKELLYKKGLVSKNQDYEFNVDQYDSIGKYYHIVVVPQKSAGKSLCSFWYFYPQKDSIASEY